MDKELIKFSQCCFNLASVEIDHHPSIDTIEEALSVYEGLDERAKKILHKPATRAYRYIFFNSLEEMSLIDGLVFGGNSFSTRCVSCSDYPFYYISDRRDLYQIKCSCGNCGFGAKTLEQAEKLWRNKNINLAVYKSNGGL